MLSGIYTVFMVVLLFGLTVFVHELGHFLAARSLGMVVDVFSIGFGPALWRRKVGDVTYKIGCIPFGGYVALPQLDPAAMQVVQGQEGAEPARVLPRIAPWKKMIVSVAGAAGNIVFAVVLAWVVFWVGRPAGPAELSATVGYVGKDSQASQAGLRMGDEILKVNGEAVTDWFGFRIACSRYQSVTLDVRRGGNSVSVTIPTGKGVFGEQAVLDVDGRSLCMVLTATPGMSAAAAGLQRGDIIKTFDGVDAFSRAQLIAMVGERNGRTVPVKIKRDGQIIDRQMTPAYDPEAKQVRIGVQFNTVDWEIEEIVHPRPWEQLKGFAVPVFRTLRALVTPSQAKAASQAIGGPVAILISYWLMMKASLMLAVFFTGLLNVNLAILNLLPIPLLDGGHVLFALWETVTRRAISARVVNVLTNFFAVLIISAFVLLTGRDFLRFTPVGRWVNRWWGPKPVAEQTIETNAATAVTNAAAGEGTNSSPAIP